MRNATKHAIGIKTVNSLNNFFKMAMLPKVFFRCVAQKPGSSDLQRPVIHPGAGILPAYPRFMIGL